MSARRPFSTKSALLALCAGSALVLAGCGDDGDTTEAATSTESKTVAGVEIAVDEEARALVPETFQESGVVRVATDVPYAPFEFFAEEGSEEITGVDYDLGQAIGAKLGLDFQFTPQKFDGIIPAIQAGKFDVVISAMTDNKERQEVLTFVDYSESGTGVLVAKGNPEGVTTYLDLCGASVGVQSGTSQVELAESWQAECAAAGAGAIDLQQFPKDSDAQLALRSGKVVATLLTKPSAGYVAKTTDDGSVFEVVDDPEAPTGYDATPNGIGVDKDHEGLPEAIQSALQGLMDDGTYTKILAEYGVEGIAIEAATINAAKA